MSGDNTFPFWPRAAAISKRTLPSKKAYITLYGTLTGDIWHVAAAEALSEYSNISKGTHPFADHDIHTCLTVMHYDKRAVPNKWPGFDPDTRPTPPQPSGPRPKEATSATSDSDGGGDEPPPKKPKEEKSEAPCVTRGRKSWFYLWSIGRLPSLVIVPDDVGAGVVGRANTFLSADAADKWLARQTDFVKKNGSTPDFSARAFEMVIGDEIDKMWQDNPHGMAWPARDGPAKDPRLIDLWCSTSVVMQMMDYLGYAEAQKILGYRLSGGASMSKAATDTAENKVVQLHNAIAGAVAKVAGRDSKAVVKGVLLFNFRVGDLNTQHDANIPLLTQVRQQAAAHGYVTIAIPQMDGKTYKKDFDRNLDTIAPGNTPAASMPFMVSETFDLLDIAHDKPSAFMDNTAKAYFWHLVASFLQGKLSPLGTPDASKLPTALAKAGILDGPQRYPVVGLIGGRSGSTDLPSFVGLRVYSWEEPLLSAVDPDRDGPPKQGDWNASYYRTQGPQALRVFNQFPVTVSGSLDLFGFRKQKKERTYEYLDLDDGRLHTWLEGGPQRDQFSVPWPNNPPPYVSVSRHPPSCSASCR